jgi:hypothetical protein
MLDFAGAIYDRISLRKFQLISLWGGIILFASGNIRAALIGPSNAWHHFAAWLLRI